VAGEPIEARPAGRVERLRRWCRRQPLLAGTLASLAIVLVTGLILVFWQWRVAEHNFQESQRHEENARREKKLADERFLLAHGLVDEFCLRLSEERLSYLPGTQRLRQELLDAGSKYFRAFLAQKPSDPELRGKLARTRLSLAMVLDGMGAR